MGMLRRECLLHRRLRNRQTLPIGTGTNCAVASSAGIQPLLIYMAFTRDYAIAIQLRV